MHHLTPSDSHVNIKGGNKRVANTVQAELKNKINQQLKYVYKKVNKCVTVSHIRTISKALLYYSEDSLMMAPKECRNI